MDRKPSAVTWWIDAPVITEAEDRKAKTESASPRRTDGYLHLMRVFDELVQNRDRNAGNMLWESDGKMWMIDHTRAFRTGKQLLQPQVLHSLRADAPGQDACARPGDVRGGDGEIPTKEEIDTLLTRRDLLVQLFDQQIAARGEAAVLYNLQ